MYADSINFSTSTCGYRRVAINVGLPSHMAKPESMFYDRHANKCSQGELRMLKRAKLAVGGLVFCCLPGMVNADNWVTDPTTDCQVWSYGDTTDGEIVTWSGSCSQKKATGRGVLVVHDKDGLLAVYDGEMLSGKGNGFGILTFRNDETGEFDRYLGSFQDSQPMGLGIFESSEGWRMEAIFEGSFDSGAGTLKLDADKNKGTDAVIRGKFKDGKLTGPALIFYEMKNGETYFGDMEDSKRQGNGTLIHANDDSYVGEFENGVADGLGVYESADGSITLGEFVAGSPNGANTYISTEGETYQGVFVDGTPDGMVLVTRLDGSQTVETWKDGEKQE